MMASDLVVFGMRSSAGFRQPLPTLSRLLKRGAELRILAGGITVPNSQLNPHHLSNLTHRLAAPAAAQGVVAGLLRRRGGLPDELLVLVIEL